MSMHLNLIFAFLLIPWLAFAGSTLEDELTLDPLGRGYSTLTNGEIDASGRVENRSRNRISMSGREIASEVVDSEYNALSDIKKTQFLSLMASEDLDPFGLGANVIKDIFGVGSTTRSNLAVARVESISRWNELGINPKIGEIEDARP